MMRNSANPAPDDGGDATAGIGSSPLLISLMPFVLLVLLYIVFPAYGAQATGDRGFDVFSLGAGMVFVFVALLWGALGIYLVSESDTYGKAIGVLLFFTAPASFIVVMAPWFKP
jgi:hypothetical protein